MSQSTYKVLSQKELRNDFKNAKLSLSETSGSDTSELTSSSQDSLDLVLVEIGSKRKVRRKRRRKMGGITNFDGAESYEELVGSAKKRRQFYILGGLCALAVIVIAAIVLSVVLIKSKDPEVDTREELELEDILKAKLRPQSFNGTWIDDNSFHFFDSTNNLNVYDVPKKTKEIIVTTNDNLEFFSGASFEFSFDRKYILTYTRVLKVFRHSFVASWSVYDVAEKRMIPLIIGGQVPSLISLVKFSPVDNSMIIVYRNNIYYKKSPTEDEIQITNDGSQNVSNGVPDWVFEEEVFSSNSATWFSPDGKKIAFVQFNDTDVPVMTLPVYGEVGEPAFQYPNTLGVNYPKVDANNPVVKLFYVDLSAVTTAASVNLHEIPVPQRFVNDKHDHLITSVSWATSDDLIAVYMNRVQNQGEIIKCSTPETTPTCTLALNLDVSGGWVEFFTAPLFNKDGSVLTFIGSNEGYRHVQTLDLNSLTKASRTSGKFVVTEILHFNKEENAIIFTANTEGDNRAQHVYAVKNEANAVKVCLTCELSNSYTYYSAEMSKGGSSIAITYMGPNVPQVHLYTINFTSSITLTNHIEFESNEVLRKNLEGKKLPKIMYDKIVLENGSESQVMMAVPAVLEEGKQYPMIVEVYGGPDSSSVTNKWSIEWGTYLVSAHEFIYVKIDGRGSGLRGDDNLFKLYRKLGTVEVEDQIETAQKLQEKYKYIDPKRTAIWGWSYGGYVSGMSLSTDTKDVYKCAVSVAPVTDWALYDSIYTERYMGLTTENAEAYKAGRLMNHVENIKTNNKTYMLVHGTLDDNVHFQQGMLLARKLERSDIQFKEITYPDEDHSLAGVRPHLYHSLEIFFDSCFEETN